MKNKKHILIVDDVTTNLRYIGELLRKDYVITMAKSGEQAFKIMEKQIPDLILLDVRMPGMDGYEIITIIKNDKRYQDIPVIFLTADKEEGNESKGLKLGASDFIRKPFDPDAVVSRIERILAQEERNKAIRLQALKDSLTGLYNRQYLVDNLARYSAMGKSGAFMLLDLDNFKGINDNYGHVVGDSALISFAKTLSGFVHQDDIVSRIGGDEFAVFLKDATDREVLKERIPGLIADVEKELDIIKIDTHKCSVSIGVSFMPDDGQEFIELYNNADKALYHVKRNGKSSFEFYDPSAKLPFSEDENTELIDLSQLRGYIDEKDDADGPFHVEYNSFKSIYRFLKRYVERTGSNVQILLFTLKDLELTESSDISAQMNILETCIKKSLRKNDVSSRYANGQYLVILMDVSDNNRRIVLDRIMRSWEKSNNNPNVLLKYDIEEIMDSDNSSLEEGSLNDYN